MTRSLRILPAALVLAACSGGTDSSNLPLRLVVQPSDSIAPGDSLRMTAHLVNPGNRPMRLEFEDQCQVVFYVLASDKTVLHPPGGGTTCMGGPTVLDLPPRDSLRFTDVWLATSAYAGEHTAYGVLWEHHEARGAEREYDRGHRSNVVILQVGARPAQ